MIDLRSLIAALLAPFVALLDALFAAVRGFLGILLACTLIAGSASACQVTKVTDDGMGNRLEEVYRLDVDDRVMDLIPDIARAGEEEEEGES